jgi:hypothetical protein
VLKFWWLIALVVAAIVAWKSAPEMWARHQAAAAAERSKFAAIAARADQQHEWVLAGDPRGTYGTTFAGPRDIWSGTHSRVASRSEGQCARHGEIADI